MMDELERIAREAAAAVRREVARITDVDAELAAVQSAPRPTHGRTGDRRVWYAVAGLASAAAAIVVALVVAAGGGSGRLEPVGPPAVTNPPVTGPERAPPSTISSSAPPSQASPPSTPATPPATPGTTAKQRSFVAEPFDLVGLCRLGEDPGRTCPSVAVGADGIAMSFDPGTMELTVHEDTPRVVPLAEPESPDTRLLHVGPDKVAYLVGRTPGLSDPIGDVVAVPTTGDAAGIVVARATEVADLSGDTDLVPTQAGLVSVGCCDFPVRRPEADAPLVMGWVDASGAPTIDDGPEVWVEFESEQRFVAYRRDGNVTQEWELPDPPAAIRGMPPLVATAAGAVALLVFDATAPTSDYVFAVYDVEAAEWRFAEIPLRYRFVALDPSGSGGLLAADPGGRLVRITPLG